MGAPQVTSAFFQYGGHYYNVANIGEIYSKGENAEHTVIQFHGGGDHRQKYEHQARCRNAEPVVVFL